MGLPLYEFRQLVGATLEDVADETGLNKSTVSKIERGISGAKLESYRALVEWGNKQAKALCLPEAKHLDVESIGSAA